MAIKANQIDKYYELAKSRRLVLNKEEFAKALGFSRVHLYRLIEANDEVVIKDLLKKAKKLIEVTNGVSRETNIVSEPDEIWEKEPPDKDIEKGSSKKKS